jgi:signal transduction histidine kinase
VLGAVVLSRTPRSILEALYGKRWHLAGLAAVLIGSVVLLASFTAFTISRPLRAVMLQARRVARGERRSIEPLRHPVTREVADLSTSLATMAQTLESRAQYVAGFAAEVSHEFKTPLTAIRGSVELLRDHLHEMSAQERARFLANIEGDVDRLDRLVRRLLELARADTLRPRPQQTASVDEVVARLAAECRRLGLAVAVQAAPGPTHVAMGAELLEAMLRNLTDNVRQHAGPSATAVISWWSDGPHAVIRLVDDGAGISAGNAPRIFDRFFTTARDVGGTGLGLAIVRSQLSAHGGAIVQVPAERGAAFEIRLPLAKVDSPARLT